MREMNIHNEAPVTHFPSKHEKQITHKIIDISIFCASRTLSVCVCVCVRVHPVLEHFFQLGFFYSYTVRFCSVLLLSDCPIVLIELEMLPCRSHMAYT